MKSTLNVDHISEHPLIAHLPRWDSKSAELTALADDVGAHGIHQPLIVTSEQHLLVDGRHRLMAARLAGIPEVPVIFCDEKEVADIVLGTLAHRRHFSKGALAYMSYPVLAAMQTSHGGDRKSKSIQSTLKSAELIAYDLGFGRDLFFQAKQLHEKFAEREDLREEYEPRILAGEIGLGACIAGLAGKQATAGGTRNDRPPEQLVFATFSDLRSRFSRWEKIEPANRKAICHEAADTILALPEEVQESILKALRAARRLAA